MLERLKFIKQGVNKMKRIYEWLKAKLNIRFVVRRLRIRFKLFNFSEKLLINGVVECECGGQIISNSGKVIMNPIYEVKCWRCGKSYNANEVFYERQEGKIVVFR
jgi:hypothetical protein